MPNNPFSPEYEVFELKKAAARRGEPVCMSNENQHSHCVMGIDPGLTGAIAFYFPSNPDRVLAEDMPIAGGEVDANTLAERIKQLGPDVAILEVVGAMPKQGVSSTFKFGAAYGAVRGVLGALQVRTVLVRPAVWKRALRLDSDKEKSRALALRTFAATPGHFSRKKDHSRAEAALLAMYGGRAARALDGAF